MQDKQILYTMNVAQSTKKKKNDSIPHDLVKGKFSPEDAKEIINHLFSEKINFHDMRSFSHKIRFGEVDQDSQARIIELKQSWAALNIVIKQAKEQGKNLKIESTISIKLV